MNEKFFTLPKARQDQIINAGFRIFAHNIYKMTMRKGCGYGYYYYRTPYEIIWQKQVDQRSELIGQRGGILWLYRAERRRKKYNNPVASRTDTPHFRQSLHYEHGRAEEQAGNP